MYVIAALYHFEDLRNPSALAEDLEELCRNCGILGLLIIADEGINGTIAGKRPAVESLLAYLRTQPELRNLEHKESTSSEPPFHRLRVKVKREIVTMGVPETRPKDKVGTYIAPQDWNEVISRDDVILVDTRNDYEVRIGKFKGAIDPDIEAFTDFPEYVEANLDPKKTPKVAMYCTGGIRCEKASSFLLDQGFDEVFHLKGGILKYLETVEPKDSTWEGECFVFDQRVSVTHGLETGDASLCFGCRLPLTASDRDTPLYEQGVSCPHCSEMLTDSRRDALRERMHQIALARTRGTVHMGDGARPSRH